MELSPEDVSRKVRLGLLYDRAARYEEAVPLLEEVSQGNDLHGEVSYRLGHALEQLGDSAKALDTYDRYRFLPTTSRFRAKMAAGHRRLVRGVARREVQRLDRLEREVSDSLGIVPYSSLDRVAQRAREHNVAVFPLSYHGEDERYRPLGKGLGALISTDLSHIRTLTVLERERLDVLIDELSLSESGYVDPATAPKKGYLLGAGKLIGGLLSIDGRGGVDVSLASVSVTTSAVEAQVSEESRLRRIFDMEKGLVFRLLDELGIDISEEERHAIEPIPTRNLQAFLAFSNGLESDDAGDISAAEGWFQRAIELDPGFGMARDKLSAIRRDDALPDGLVSSRHDALSESIGGMTTPGPDDRDPAVEAGAASRGLPVPPDPPGGNR